LHTFVVSWVWEVALSGMLAAASVVLFVYALDRAREGFEVLGSLLGHAFTVHTEYVAGVCERVLTPVVPASHLSVPLLVSSVVIHRGAVPF
jgi:hypothetical protein